MIALTAAVLITPLEEIEQPLLLLDGGVIAEVTSRRARQIPRCRTIDLGDTVLAPGYLDMHIHGGAGHDVMAANPEALRALERLLVQHGVTAYVPTTVSAPIDATCAALERLADAIEKRANNNDAADRARPLGIHLEGPFISHAKRGVHPAEHLLRPTLALFDQLWQAARGHVKVMTIAPELEGAPEVIAEAVRRGVCVSLGHSDADMGTTQAAIEKGARHSTHTFNAMRALDHRNPGILGAVLSDDRVTCDLIADGIHVDPEVVKIFLKAKGPERAVLITDAISATGMPEGRYRLGSFEVEVRDGMCMLQGVLAGSVLTMDRAVHNIMKFARWDLRSAVRLASFNPASELRLERKGMLKAGADADLVVLSRAGEVMKTIVAGKA